MVNSAPLLLLRVSYSAGPGTPFLHIKSDLGPFWILDCYPILDMLVGFDRLGVVQIWRRKVLAVHQLVVLLFSPESALLAVHITVAHDPVAPRPRGLSLLDLFPVPSQATPETTNQSLPHRVLSEFALWLKLVGAWPGVAVILIFTHLAARLRKCT